MKNKQSGWVGKVKVTLSIICTIIFSGIIVQCNSSLEAEAPEASGLTAGRAKAGEVNLPVLPDRRDPVELDLTDALNFSIAHDQLTINGKAYQVAEIVSMIENGGYSQPVTIIMSIDKDQKMGFVRNVQMELRKAEQRKLLYLGQNSEGKSVQTSLLLPPFPYNENGIKVATEKEMLTAGVDILKINMGEHHENLKKKVYDYVNNHINKQSSDYVVSAKFMDDDIYGNYLLNLVYIKDAFNQIYQENAQEMYGKNLFNLNKDEFKNVRAGIPMAVSIGDKPEI